MGLEVRFAETVSVNRVPAFENRGRFGHGRLRGLDVGPVPSVSPSPALDPRSRTALVTKTGVTFRPPGSSGSRPTDDPGFDPGDTGTDEEFTVKPWMWLAGGAVVLGGVWYFTRGRKRSTAVMPDPTVP